MSLSAQSVQAKLVDVLQASSIGKNTCRIQVSTLRGRGVIHMENGEVSDALFGDLTGVDAFYALWNSEGADCVLSSGLKNGTRSIHEPLQTLMLNAMTLRFEERSPVPTFVVSAPPFPRPIPLAARAKLAEDARPAEKSRTGLLVAAFFGCAALAVAAFAGLRPLMKATPVQSAPNFQQRAAVPSTPVEVTALTHPGDETPRLLAGTAPRSPDPTSAVFPSIICRILVDESGSVADAKIFRSRLDLSAFEDAALSAVKSYTFSPGKQAGHPIAVWLNFSIGFQ